MLEIDIPLRPVRESGLEREADRREERAGNPVEEGGKKK